MGKLKAKFILATLEDAVSMASSALAWFSDSFY